MRSDLRAGPTPAEKMTQRRSKSYRTLKKRQIRQTFENHGEAKGHEDWKEDKDHAAFIDYCICSTSGSHFHDYQIPYPKDDELLQYRRRYDLCCSVGVWAACGRFGRRDRISDCGSYCSSAACALYACDQGDRGLACWKALAKKLQIGLRGLCSRREMVLGYFVVEVLLFGFGGALEDLPFNLFQVVAGIAVGPATALLLRRILPSLSSQT